MILPGAIHLNLNKLNILKIYVHKARHHHPYYENDPYGIDYIGWHTAHYQE